MKDKVYITDKKDIDFIVRAYISGKSAPELAKQFHCSHPSIYKVLKKNGVVSRDKYERRRKNKVNDNFFEKINTHEKAQILGMYAADGCILNESRTTIRLKKEDKYYLEWIKERLGFTGKIVFSQPIDNSENGFGIGTGSYAFSTFSRKIISDLNRLGLTERKSLILDFPTFNQVPKEFINSYILGYFEGDGSISINKEGHTTIDICATLSFCQKLIRVIKEVLDINGRIYKADNNQIHHFMLNGNHQVLKFLDWIYKDSTFQMKRKYEKYIRLRNRYDTIPVCHNIISFGENNGHSKLTIENVLDIWTMHKKGIYQRDIAKCFDVSQPCIGSILKKETWKCVLDKSYMEKYHKELYEKNLSIYSS